MQVGRHPTEVREVIFAEHVQSSENGQREHSQKIGGFHLRFSSLYLCVFCVSEQAGNLTPPPAVAKGDVGFQPINQNVGVA